MSDANLKFPYPSDSAGMLSAAEDPTQPFDGRAPCIMLVDDDPMIPEVLRLHLSDAGYERFVTTSDSTAAYDLARDRQPDLVLLDLMMPEVNGFEVLHALRSDSATRLLPVIVLTSATDAESKLRALELGATDFLAKPVDPSELALRVRNSLAVKAYQDRLAFCDQVTGLANRRYFIENLRRTLSAGSNDASKCVVVQVGIDRFKQINDAMGYGAGDQVLKILGARIRERLEAVVAADSGPAESLSTVARTGGDEFMMLMPGLAGEEDLEHAANELRRCVAEPVTELGDGLYLTASIGVAVWPKHGTTVDTLLARSNQALSFAKKRGGDSVELYSEKIDSWARERMDLERDLRVAAQRDELCVHYQPKVDVHGGHVRGAEALVRWTHPILGNRSPMEFIPLAEETGLIVEIGEWVLRDACREASTWTARGMDPISLSVNVSARQFQEPDFTAVVANALSESGLAPARLTLEVTESVLMVDPDEAQRSLRSLNSLGVKVSVDDFGTGYSSLAYLKRFKVDELKIDRSFVREVPDNEDDVALVSTILAMAANLGLEVVAEGVETTAQLAFLSRSRSRCGQYQGFLFSRPLPAEEFVAFVNAQAPGPGSVAHFG